VCAAARARGELQGPAHLLTKGCGGFDVLTSNGVDTSSSEYFDSATGKLIAITNMTLVFGERCIAGPSDFLFPSCPSSTARLLTCPDAGDAGLDATDGGGGSITCGTATCSTATDVCCVTMGGDGGTGFTSTCESAANCTTAMGVGLQCGATADCPMGLVCCLGLGAAMSSGCEDFRSATSNCYNGGTQLCDPNAPYNSQRSAGCNVGLSCMPGGTGGRLPMNYWTCQ
jgi:hypothetical protein